ncbi:SI1L3 protein, partial [Turnix velox]|nr:SI1L3 protein [Turnix velox]
AGGTQISSILAISKEFVVLVDLQAKEVVFNCFSGDVLGWTPEGNTLKIFYGRGDQLSVQ